MISFERKKRNGKRSWGATAQRHRKTETRANMYDGWFAKNRQPPKGSRGGNKRKDSYLAELRVKRIKKRGWERGDSRHHRELPPGRLHLIGVSSRSKKGNCGKLQRWKLGPSPREKRTREEGEGFDAVFFEMEGGGSSGF